MRPRTVSRGIALTDNAPSGATSSGASARSRARRELEARESGLDRRGRCRRAGTPSTEGPSSTTTGRPAARRTRSPQRPPAAADRDHRIARRSDREVPRMADTGDDDVVRPRVASSRRSPGRIAMVVPPAAFAPRWAAAMTSSSPPVDDDASPLGEEPSDRFGVALVLPSAPYDRHLTCHGCDPRGGGASRGTGRHPRRGRRLRRRLRRAAPREARRDDRESRQLHALTPLLPEAAAGRSSRDTSSCRCGPCARTRSSCSAASSRGTRAEVGRRRDPRGAFEIGYERLVVALGAVPRTFPVPGLAEHGKGFKDVADAIALRNRLLRALESAAARSIRTRPHAISASSSSARATRASKRWPSSTTSPRTPSAGRTRRCAAPRSAGCSSTPLRGSSGDPAQARGVHAPRARGPGDRDPRRHDPRVVRRARSRARDGTRVPARTLVWAAGVRAHPRSRPSTSRSTTAGASSSRNPARRRHARCVVARRLRAPCPNTKTPERSTRQPASTRSGRPGGSRRTSSASRAPYGYRMLGQVATLGRYKGIAELPGIRLRGFPGWWWPGRTTSTRCRRSAGRCASSPTGRSRCSSAATSSSSPRSGTSATSARTSSRSQRSARSAAPSDWPPSSTRAKRSPSRATRSSTTSIVNDAVSSPGFTSSQRSGVDTGAPARGRTE